MVWLFADAGVSVFALQIWRFLQGAGGAAFALYSEARAMIRGDTLLCMFVNFA
jgi:hypothetical protein